MISRVGNATIEKVPLFARAISDQKLLFEDNSNAEEDPDYEISYDLTIANQEVRKNEGKPATATKP